VTFLTFTGYESAGAIPAFQSGQLFDLLIGTMEEKPARIAKNYLAASAMINALARVYVGQGLMKKQETA